MALILFDTNIFIDMLNGVHEATVELTYYDDAAISVITYMELRSGERAGDKAKLDAILQDFEVLPMDQRVIDEAIQLRLKSLNGFPPKLKLPDSIIAATAKVHGLPLVTRNPDDFKGRGHIVHVPYLLDTTVKPAVATNVAHYTFPPAPKLTKLK